MNHLARLARAIAKALAAFADELGQPPPARPARDPASTTAARIELGPRRSTPTGFGKGGPR